MIQTFVCDRMDSGDNMERIIFHIDVNNAFLSWTAIDLLNKGSKYDIRNSYAVIGGDETARRGIVLAKSMPAKKCGIYTSETLYSARKKCPALRIFPPNYKWYQEMSGRLFRLLSEYTNDIEVFSIDECSLDYGKVKHLYGDEVKFAYALKDRIKKELGFTVNIGVANNKLCAKMASDFTKPDKVHTLFQHEIEGKMFPLPINELFGVGKKSSEKLRLLHIDTIGDLAHTSVGLLYPYFKNQSEHLIRIANGIDDSPVNPDQEENKGISSTTTLSHDVTSKSELYMILNIIVENITLTLRRQNRYASVVAVILKDQYFRSYTHQRKLNNATNLTAEVFQISKELLDECWKGEAIRLIGVRLNHLTKESKHQVSLFDSIEQREHDLILEKTVDQLKEKFGGKIVHNASLKDHAFLKNNK